MAELSNPELIEEMRWQLRKIEERQADNARLMAGLAQSDQKLGALSVTATSADRSVTVVSGPGGVVTDVQLTPEALRSDADALSRLITATIRDAVASAAREQLSIVREHAGREVDPAEVLGPQARFLDRPAAPSSASQRRPEPADDELYDSIFDE